MASIIDEDKEVLVRRRKRTEEEDDLYNDRDEDVY